MKSLLLVLVLTLGLVSCSKTTTEETPYESPNKDKADEFAAQLAEYYGAEVIVLKYDTEKGGAWVAFEIDGMTIATDLDVFGPGSIDQLDIGEWDYATCTNCNYEYAAYLDTIDSSGNYQGLNTYPTGTDVSLNPAWVFEEGSEAPKDLAHMAAKLELQGSDKMAFTLESEYGFSSDRAQDIARTATAFRKMNSKRSLTPAERNTMTNKMLGLDFKKVEDAVVGKTNNLNELLEQAANFNGVEPEAMQAVMQNLLQ